MVRPEDIKQWIEENLDGAADSPARAEYSSTKWSMARWGTE